GRFDVDAGVEGAFAVERILARTEARSQATLHGPHRGRVGKFSPVARKAGRKTAFQCAGHTPGERLCPQSIKLIEGELDLLLVDVVSEGQGDGSRSGRAVSGCGRLGG